MKFRQTARRIDETRVTKRNRRRSDGRDLTAPALGYMCTHIQSRYRAHAVSLARYMLIRLIMRATHARALCALFHSGAAKGEGESFERGAMRLDR